MTDKTTFHVALIGGPLNAHQADEHVERAIEVDGAAPPGNIRATPARLLFDVPGPPTVGRYEKVDFDERIAGIVGDLPAQPDAFYEWQAGTPAP